jgi:protein TonB
MFQKDFYFKNLCLFIFLTSLFFLSTNIFANNILLELPFLPNDEDYLAFAEEMPSPIGGIEAIMKKITYPNIAKQAGLEGKVILLIYINEQGGVDDVKIVKGVGGGCDEEAVSAIKKTKFTPGKSKGAATKVKLTLAITFKLK